MRFPVMNLQSFQSLVVDSETLVQNLKNGSAVLFPTDTLPALASSVQSANQLWNLKKRPRDKPLILMGSSPEELFQYVLPKAIDDVWLLANDYWPGALTLVVPASGEVVDALNPGSSSIGIRIPENEMTMHLLKKSGPLATTSANLSGEIPSMSAEDAATCFPQLPLLGPIPWPKPSGQASTVVAWRGQGCWQLLRRGAVIPKRI